MNSGKNDCNSKIEILFKLFSKYKGGNSGKVVIVVDRYSRPMFVYPRTIKLKDMNLSKMDPLVIEMNYSLD